jgi:hypothetical protein
MVQKLLFIILIIFITSSSLHSQIPFYPRYISARGKSLTVKLADNGVLPKVVYPNKRINYLDKNYFLIQDSDKSEIITFVILKENNDLLVLCNQEVNDICDCQEGTFLFYQPQQKLQRIEKAFSFSLKKTCLIG